MSRGQFAAAGGAWKAVAAECDTGADPWAPPKIDLETDRGRGMERRSLQLDNIPPGVSKQRDLRFSALVVPMYAIFEYIYLDQEPPPDGSAPRGRLSGQPIPKVWQIVGKT